MSVYPWVSRVAWLAAGLQLGSGSWAWGLAFAATAVVLDAEARLEGRGRTWWRR